MLTIQYLFCRVEFQDVHRLSDGQVKHSSEVFYAGSLWKVCNILQLMLFLKYLSPECNDIVYMVPQTRGGKID